MTDTKAEGDVACEQQEVPCPAPVEDQPAQPEATTPADQGDCVQDSDPQSTPAAEGSPPPSETPAESSASSETKANEEEQLPVAESPEEDQSSPQNDETEKLVAGENLIDKLAEALAETHLKEETPAGNVEVPSGSESADPSHTKARKKCLVM